MRQLTKRDERLRKQAEECRLRMGMPTLEQKEKECEERTQVEKQLSL